MDQTIEDLEKASASGKGLYGVYGIENLTEDWDPDELQFHTFYGGHFIGKSTIPKLLLSMSGGVELVDPFFTLLEGGIVLMGIYPAHITDRRDGHDL